MCVIRNFYYLDIKIYVQFARWKSLKLSVAICIFMLSYNQKILERTRILIPNKSNFFFNAKIYPRYNIILVKANF